MRGWVCELDGCSSTLKLVHHWVNVEVGILRESKVAWVILTEVSISVVAMIDTITFWNESTTTSWRVVSSKTPRLNFQWCGLKKNDKSGKWTRLLLRSNVKEHFLKKDVSMRMLPIVGSTMQVSSEIFHARRNWIGTCFRVGMMLPLAISIS